MTKPKEVTYSGLLSDLILSSDETWKWRIKGLESKLTSLHFTVLNINSFFCKVTVWWRENFVKLFFPFRFTWFHLKRKMTTGKKGCHHEVIMKKYEQSIWFCPRKPQLEWITTEIIEKWILSCRTEINSKLELNSDGWTFGWKVSSEEWKF